MNTTTYKMITPHSVFRTPADYISDGELRPECVKVRLNRIARLDPRSRLTWYEVEISILDKDYTHRDKVNEALKGRGFKVLTHGSTYVAALIGAPKGWRGPKGYVYVEDLSA